MTENHDRDLVDPHGFKPYGFWHRQIDEHINECYLEIMKYESSRLPDDYSDHCDDDRSEKYTDLYSFWVVMMDLQQDDSTHAEEYDEAIVLKGKIIENLNYLTKNKGEGCEKCKSDRIALKIQAGEVSSV
jgi:hypothetical protein